MATTYYLSPVTLIVQYLTNLGVMAAGAQINTYLAGTVSTPQPTYTDSTGIVANANPMTANGAGRPATPSGAPAAFWTPGGTALKLVVTDAAGNQLVNIDNIQAINDLTANTNALQALLASGLSTNVAGTGPVGGADYVANAVKSYDVFASIRAANIPTLGTNQTLIVIAQGGGAAGDGLGGAFYWSTSSSAADDGKNVLRPTSAPATGRYLRLLARGQSLTLSTTANQSVTNSTVLVVAPELIAAMIAGGQYLVQMRLLFQGAVATGAGYKVQPNYSNSLAVVGNGGAGVASSNLTPGAIMATPNAPTGIAAISTGAPDVFNADVLVDPLGSGTFAVNFAQNAATANPTTLLVGSTITVTRVN